MGSRATVLTQRQFTGANKGVAPHLLLDTELSELHNLRLIDGELHQINPRGDLSSTNNFTQSDYNVVLWKMVPCSSSLFPSNTQYTNVCYLYVGTDGKAWAVNPEDLTDVVSIPVIWGPEFGFSPTYTEPVADEANYQKAMFYLEGFDEGYGSTVLRFNLWSAADQTGGPTTASSDWVSAGIYVTDNDGTDWTYVHSSSTSLDELVEGHEFTIVSAGTLNGKTFKIYLQFAGATTLGWTANDPADYIRYSTTIPAGVPAQLENPFIGLQTTSCFYGDDLFFTYYGRLMMFNGKSIVSAGFEPITGLFVTNFFNHIMLARTNPYEDGFSVDQRPETGFYGNLFKHKDSINTVKNEDFSVGWSHLDGPHEWNPLANNEADTYTIAKPHNDAHFYGITAMEKWNDSVFIFTQSSCFRIDYVGLPLVMQVYDLGSAASCLRPGCSCVTPQGIALINGSGKFGFFNGVSFSPVGEKFDSYLVGLADSIKDFEDLEITFTYGYSQTLLKGYINMSYDPYDDNVYFHFLSKDGTEKVVNEVTLDMETGSWHRWVIKKQTANLADNYPCPVYVRDLRNPDVKLYANDLIYTEYTADAIALPESFSTVEDSDYTEPYVITKDYVFDDIVRTKVFSDLWLDIDYLNSSGLWIYYSKRDKLRDDIVYSRLSAAESNTNKVLVHLPRSSARIFRFKFVFKLATTNGLVRDARIYAWSGLIYGIQEDMEK